MLARKLLTCIFVGAICAIATAGPAPATQPAPIPLDPPRQWTADPAWMQQPPAQLEPVTPAPTKPEPIPLPAAAIVGPIVLTAILASAAIKKSRRRRARVIR